MPKYALKIEYTGSQFFGWQSQIGLPTIQGEIETALSNLDNNQPKLVGAGRTDAGVHALGQVAHVNLSKNWDPFRLSEAINFHLKPHPISIIRAAKVEKNWHARFSAINRHYIFKLVVRRAPLTHHRNLVWHIKHKLDWGLMQEGASFLVGTHDFTTFRSTLCQAQSPIRTIDSIEINKIDIPNGVEYQFLFKARSYLHNQIRSFVGTLERVGAGKWSPLEVNRALNAKSRPACGPVCTPNGLYLKEVIYSSDPFGH